MNFGNHFELEEMILLLLCQLIRMVILLESYANVRAYYVLTNPSSLRKRVFVLVAASVIYTSWGTRARINLQTEEICFLI